MQAPSSEKYAYKGLLIQSIFTAIVYFGLIRFYKWLIVKPI